MQILLISVEKNHIREDLGKNIKLSTDVAEKCGYLRQDNRINN